MADGPPVQTSPVQTSHGAPSTPAHWADGHPPHACDGWQWDLPSLAVLRRIRAEVRDRVRDEVAHPTDPASEPAERMLLALDELASNGLRHGRHPVALRICPLPEHWLVDVTDAAIDTTPSPSPGRPAGQGGYGLFVIAGYASEYGWVAAPDCKHVWALLPRNCP